MESQQTNGWNELQAGLRKFYFGHQKGAEFDGDSEYLRKAYLHTEELWHNNFDSVAVVNLVILAEAPLYKDEQSYFYNERSGHTNFLWPNDVQGLAGNGKIDDSKASLIRALNDLGVIVLDVFPFALHENTAFQYEKLKNTPERYSELARIGEHHLQQKIDLIEKKRGPSTKFLLRYPRIAIAADVVLKDYLVKKGFISAQDKIDDMFKQGGFVDRDKFHRTYRVATQEAPA